MADELDEQMKAALSGLMSHQRRILLKERSIGRWYRFTHFLFFGAMLLAVMVLDNIVESAYGKLVAIASVILLIVLSGVAMASLVRWRNQAIGGRIMGHLKRQGIRPHLCLNCEYDLKGSTSDQCPECGTALAPVTDDAEEGDPSPQL